MTPERPTIVFDVDGLTNIPGFKAHVFDPLADTKRFNLAFWSLVGSSGEDSRLIKCGFSRGEALILGGDVIQRARTWVNDCYFDNTRDVWYEPDPSFQLTDLEIYPDDLRLSKVIDWSAKEFGRKRLSEKYKGKIISRYAKWRDTLIERWRQTGRDSTDILKYPPLLSDKPTLLVESDCSIIQEEPSRVLRLTGADNACIDFAKRSGFSLVLTPEYYDPSRRETVWDREGPSAQTGILEPLRNILLNWRGERFTKDLGEDLGIYPYFRNKEMIFKSNWGR